MAGHQASFDDIHRADLASEGLRRNHHRRLSFYILQLAPPDQDSYNVGILLFDTKTAELWIQLAPPRLPLDEDLMEYMESLAESLNRVAADMGPHWLMKYLEETLSNVLLISKPKVIFAEDPEKTLHALYDEVIEVERS